MFDPLTRIDIVLITRDRPELTEQCIRSLNGSAARPGGLQLVVVYDGTPAERAAFVHSTPGLLDCATRFGAWIETGGQIGVGGAKNKGAAWIKPSPEKTKYVGDNLLMFVDNDMLLLPDWDAKLQYAMSAQTNTPTQLGGWRHPYHQLGRNVGDFMTHEGAYDVREVDAVTGNCFVMRWSDWLKYGPFDSNAIGPGQSEDYALSQRVKLGGGLVATLDPPVAIHCGLVNSVGEPATGWRECEEQITEQLAGLSVEMRDSVLIMRPAPEQWTDDSQRIFEAIRTRLDMQPRYHGVPLTDERKVGLNIASGQRRFESTSELQWFNIDAQVVEPDRVPDIVCNVGVQSLPFGPLSVDLVVIHQGLEHAGCGESEPMLRECWRVLARGGSLIVTVPDMRKLAARWLGGELDTQLFMTSVYGAYMGDEADRHKWGFDYNHLAQTIRAVLDPREGAERRAEIYPRAFDWRPIPGADIARDWWILGVEVVKP